MPASLKTQYFQLPVYAPNDTANYLVTYNGTMEKLDAILQSQKTALEDTAGTVAANGETLSTVQQTADTNKSTLDAITKYSKFVPTKAEWVKAGSILNAVLAGDNVSVVVNVTSTEGGDNDSSGVITVDANKAMLPLFSVPENPFGMENHSYGKGVGVVTALVGADASTAKAQALDVVLATEDGSVTYVALLIDKDMPSNKVFAAWGNVTRSVKDLIDFYTPIA